MLRNTKVERILYSVDYPFSSNKDGLKFLEELKASGLVTEDQLERIAYKNAERAQAIVSAFISYSSDKSIVLKDFGMDPTCLLLLTPLLEPRTSPLPTLTIERWSRLKAYSASVNVWQVPNSRQDVSCEAGTE